MRNTAVRLALVTLVLSPLPALAGADVSVPCTAGRIELETGSTVDLGTSGLMHSAELASGAAIGFDIVSRCSDDSSRCLADGDCANDDCAATCDCDSDTSCEIAGPLGERRCLTTLEECSSDEDCPEAVACVPFFAPPQPLVGGGLPLCVNQNFAGPVEGTIDTSTGEVTFSGRLNWRYFLGITTAMPCPRCGAPEDDPQIGDSDTCEGGQRDGLACTVDGVTEGFGGTSYDCAPTLASNISGGGVPVPLFEMSTEATARSAALPCSFFGFNGNPLVPGSNPKCTDARGAEDPLCSSNADCRRCSENSSIACANNGDCNGSGFCAEAPDQPVTCGFWCHCGFCDGDPGLPCMENADCPDEQECEKGTSFGNTPGAPQTLPNKCDLDGFLCGTDATETCETTTRGSCHSSPLAPCTNNSDCVNPDDFCEFTPLACFESRIEREGSSSALGSYCAHEDKACSSNADCTLPDDFCAEDVARPSLAGLSCMGGTASGAVNAFAGITGPATFQWETRLTICGCDQSEAGCEEVCNVEPGCGDGIVEGNELCDGGPCCKDDCSFEEAIVVCREAAGECDAAETCTGSTATCPANAPADDGTSCDDETACTTNDVCTDGVCGGTTACGDGSLDAGCGEECDDGNTENGDGCSETCGPQTLCGDANEDGDILTADALRVLQKAVGLQVECDLTICDVDSSGVVQTNDALRVLRKAVELEVELDCNYGS